MGIFTLRKKKKDNTEPFEHMTIDEALKKYAPINDINRDDVMAIASTTSEQISEIKRQLEESKSEYDAVTSYLSDIQKIDALPLEQKKGIEAAAEQIIQLQIEQKKYQVYDKKISDAQYHDFSILEEDIIRELPRLKEQEEYQTLVKEDLRQLEGEKGVQNYEKEDALSKKEFLRKLSIASLALFFFLFVIILWIANSTQADMTVPFFMSGIMAILIIFYIIWEERRSTYRLKLAEKKLNRVIMLINKVKIKYVNCTSGIDYAYEKYHVNSSVELDYLFREYKHVKEKMTQMEKSSELLKQYQGELMKKLRHADVEDTQSWCYQAEALLDKKEMVEVRHRLNVRRQKLRERIDYNTRELDAAMTTIMNLRSRHADLDDEIRRLLN